MDDFFDVDDTEDLEDEDHGEGGFDLDRMDSCDIVPGREVWEVIEGGVVVAKWK
jgi:hypothetical protein